jgi:hypothetical protein
LHKEAEDPQPVWMGERCERGDGFGFLHRTNKSRTVEIIKGARRVRVYCELRPALDENTLALLPNSSPIWRPRVR